MRWFPDLANAAFWETIELRRKILEREPSRNPSVHKGLEPSNAEFIAALAAGNNSHNILQVGCGISTIALAVAAQATGGLFVSIQVDEAKQDIVRSHMDYLGLLASVELLVASEPINILLTRTNVDFAHFTGDPMNYIQLFDSLNLSDGAIVAADSVLSAASDEYIRHVRQQPGVQSSTLPLARGVEVTKFTSWEKFNAGRLFYSGLRKSGMKASENGIPFVPFAQIETTNFAHFWGDQQKLAITRDQTLLNVNEQASSSFGSSGVTFTSHDTWCGGDDKDAQLSDTQHEDRSIAHARLVADDVSRNFISCSSKTATDIKKPIIEGGIATDKPDTNYDIVEFQSAAVLDKACSSFFEVHFQNYSTETEVTITGVNRDMLLSDITTAFSEMGISVKTANIKTHNDLIEDVFFVTDTKARAPLHPSQWNSVREKILENICKRCMQQSLKG